MLELPPTALRTCVTILFKEVDGSIKSRLLKLNELIQEAYESQEVPAECRIHYMEARFFCGPAAPHQNYPDLMHQFSQTETDKVADSCGSTLGCFFS